MARFPTLLDYLCCLLVYASVCHAQCLEANGTNWNSTNGSGIHVVAILPTLPNGRIYGWIGQPDYRGTMDIVWTSLFTIFVCTYTILYLNVPAENESHLPILRRRLWWMTIAIAGPEFILTAACGQWSRANEARKAFRDSGYSSWTLRHGFFADMGGFLLVPKDYPPFPVNNEHIHYIVTNNYIGFPDFTEVELCDRSKQDGIAKVITSAQVGYMVIEIIGRAGQGLSIMTLELSALAIVICSLLTSITWLRKPADVLTPIRLPMNTPMERILIEAGDAAAKPFKQTPLDFVDDLKPSWGLNVQTFMRLPVSPHERPLPRLPNDRLPYLSESQQALLCLACLVYASVHLLGWNFPFPTRTERILWRVCSMFLFANTAAFWILETVAAYWRFGPLQHIFKSWLSKCDKLLRRRSRPDWRQEREIPDELPDNEPRELPLPAEFWSILPVSHHIRSCQGLSNY